MTIEELVKDIVNKINYKEILNKINTWGKTMTEKEKKELFKIGGVL